jgi:hypothetical protein
VFDRLAAAPSGKSTRDEHGGQKGDGGEFRSIQHGFSFSSYILALIDQ